MLMSDIDIVMTLGRHDYNVICMLMYWYVWNLVSTLSHEVESTGHKIPNDDVHNLYFSHNIPTLVKLLRIIGVSHIARMREMRNANNIFFLETSKKT
jgi:hypothetical protein